MLGSRMLKELKKRLKRQKRPLWSLGCWAAIALLVTVLAAAAIRPFGGGARFGDVDAAPVWGAFGADEPAAAFEPGRKGTLRALARWNGDVEVVLRRVFWCGEETRRLGLHSTAAASELIRAHREWEAVFDASGRVIMMENVDDLSPECRKSAYIAMDENGNLSLFDGPPARDKVIRTFFQLDISSLEANLPKDKLHELASGIRVTDRDEYNSVLSTFSDYARAKSRETMKPQA